MGTYKNELVSDEIRESIARERRRSFLETAVQQRHGYIKNIGDMTDADLERMAPPLPSKENQE
jgi:hypothetical protein